VQANVDLPDEIALAVRHDAAGVGLLRTEFLVTGRAAMPTEDEQVDYFRRVADAFGGRQIVIRSYDLGGDKFPAVFRSPHEANPFLGWRSIRVCLDQPEIFRPQLRAVLRAAAGGRPIGLMLPLVTEVEEVLATKEMLLEEALGLSRMGIPAAATVPIGVMIETPAAVVVAEALARHSAFFSIGTNDLVQYTLAVDRTNERVASMFNPAHPAVIKLIKDVSRVCRRRSLPLSCCGEAAGDPDFAVLLIGLGVRTLSATAASIPSLKRLVRSVTIEQCEKIARRALSLDSDVSVAAFLRDQTRKIIPEAFDGRSVEERI
jgi:phosphotransferase system enzyme I (PtsI)